MYFVKMRVSALVVVAVDEATSEEEAMEIAEAMSFDELVDAISESAQDIETDVLAVNEDEALLEDEESVEVFLD